MGVPTDIAGLMLWLKADALSLNDNDPVTTWTDSSGLSNDATQSTSGNKPVYKTNIVNSLPIVRFAAASSKHMALPNFMTGKTAATVFWVAKITNDPSASTPTSGPPLGDLGSSADANLYPFTDGTIYDETASTTRKTVGNPSLSLSAAFRYISIISGSANWKYYVNGSVLLSTGTNTVGFGSTPWVGRSLTACLTWRSLISTET